MQGYPVTVRFPLHWGEMDALGHANNARFFTWFESARIAYFERVGLRLEPTQVGPILKRCDCEFLRPVVWPAELIVGARVTDSRTTSFTMLYAVARAEEPEVPFARGSAIVVLVDYRSGQKVPIPDDLRARIEALERPT